MGTSKFAFLAIAATVLGLASAASATPLGSTRAVILVQYPLVLRCPAGTYWKAHHCALRASSGARESLRHGITNPSSITLARQSKEFTGSGAALFKTCAEHGLEGIISKEANSAYRNGLAMPKTTSQHSHSPPSCVSGFE
jgi:hypothetical protein